MKRTFYLVLSFIGIALLALPNRGLAQGSGIYGTTQVHSGGHMGIFGSLTFVSGYVVTPRNEPDANIYFTAGATYSGASNSSHVNGYAEKAGTTAFLFPVGDGTKLRPVGISAPASAGNYQAAYFSTSPASATAPTGAPFPTTNLGTGVTAVSTTEYWDVNGSGAVNLTLTWDASSNLTTLTGGDMNRLVVVGYNTSTSKWENLGRAGGVTGTMSTTGTVTANAVTPNTYAAFTFGASGALPNLPTFGVITIPSTATAVISVVPSGGTTPYSYSICGTTPTSSGSATVSNTGVVTYIPATSFTGSASVCLSVCDASNPQNCNTTTIPFLVTGGGGGIGTTSPASSYTIIIAGDPSGVTSSTLAGSGGTAPYTYSLVSCQTGSAATTSSQGGNVTVNATTGAYSYTAPVGFTGTDYICIRVCDASNPQVCSITTIGIRVPSAAGLIVNAKAFLQGPLVGTLMNDGLRSANLIPATDPYGKGTTVSSSVLATTGNTAIVDWVLLELRSSTSTVTESKAALIRRDGAIVSPTDGTSPVSFSSAAGSYYIDVRHRNHLGVMTATAISLNATPTTIDFTNPSTATLGGVNAQKTVGSVKAMWAGNVVSGTPEVIKYSALNNDLSGITSVVTAGGGTLSSVKSTVYSSADTNLDGTVKYTGLNRDQDLIFNNVKTHPLNASGSLSYVIQQPF